MLSLRHVLDLHCLRGIAVSGRVLHDVFDSARRTAAVVLVISVDS